MLEGIRHGRVTERRGDSTSCYRRIYDTKNLLLLAMCLAILRSIIFSSRSIDEIRSKEQIAQITPSGSQRHRNQQLPSWRLGTDCSMYSFDCFAVAEREAKYMPYPFTLHARKEVEAIINTSVTNNEGWSVETIEKLPTEWIQYLENNETQGELQVKDRNYLYPPTVSDKEYQTCVSLAINGNKTTIQQLDILFSGNSPRVVPEPDTNMVAFTVSDYAYVEDMLHDVFQMMDDIVGFSEKHFFLVAIDEKSAELACRYGYPVVFWKADENNLRDAVANTKLIVSHELVKRGINFIFAEMDVWWIRSPKPKLIDFQKSHDGIDHSGKHLYFSGHQNNHKAANIGVYAARADQYTEEFFRVCLDVLKEKPETHDQYVMQRVQNLFSSMYGGKEMEFKEGQFKPEGVPKTPQIKYPFHALMFSPHEIVADERPTITHKTLAIHTLNNMPLQAPHGKKMNAKELGVYYGFHSHPKENLGTDSSAAGYYDRRGKNRRFLWLDTDTRNNFYSHSDSNHYHDKNTFEWTMAILIAIARKTNRILVLPQIFNADMDAGTYFAWTLMDYSAVTGMVDFRETNFLSNPKAWRNDESGAEYWPFESVVNTALFGAVGDRMKISIYTQISDRSSIISKEVWKYKSTVDSREWLDAWIGSLSGVPKLDSAEVLMVNPDLFMDSDRIKGLNWRMKKARKSIDAKGNGNKSDPPIGLFEREVLEIYGLLGWCWEEGFRHTANKVSASDSCYGRGKPGTIKFN